MTPRIAIRLEGEGAEQTSFRQHIIARKMRWTREAGWEELADDRLFPNQWLTLDLPLPAQRAGRVTVRVEPDYDYHERVYPALQKLLEGSLSETDSALITTAREQAGQTAYTLYRYHYPPWRGEAQPCEAQ